MQRSRKPSQTGLGELTLAKLMIGEDVDGGRHFYLVEWIMAGLVYQLQSNSRVHDKSLAKTPLHIDVTAPEISPLKMSFFVLLSLEMSS